MTDSCELLGRFRNRPLGAAIRPLIAVAIEQLNRLTQDSYHVPHTLFGRRVEMAVREELLSMYAVNYTRPSRHHLLVLIPKEPTVLLPGIRATDFCRLMDLLRLETPVEWAILAGLARRDYGIFERKCPPERIRDEEDLRRWSIPFDGDLNAFAFDRCTLWWQKWGGLLYSLIIDCNPEHPAVREEPLSTFVGAGERLPTSLIR